MASTEQMSHAAKDAAKRTAKTVRKQAKRAKRKLLIWLEAKLAKEGMKDSKAAVQATVASAGEGAAKAVGALKDTLREAGATATETAGTLKETLKESGETVESIQDALREIGDAVRALKDALPLREAGEAAAGTVGALKEALPLRETGEAAAGAVGTLEGAVPHGKPREAEAPEEEAERAETKGAKEKPEGEQRPEAEEAKKPPEKEAERAEAKEAQEKPEGEQRPEAEEAKKPPEKEAAPPQGNGSAPTEPKEAAASEKAEKRDGAGGYLGMTTYPVSLSEKIADEFGTKGGLMLLDVAPNGPADDAGLLPGDTLLTLEGDPVRSLDDLKERLTPESVGRKLHAKVLRAGEPKEADLEVGSPP